MSYCEQCGNELKSGAKFCGKCGSKIEETDFRNINTPSLSPKTINTIQVNKEHKSKFQNLLFSPVKVLLIILLAIIAGFVFVQSIKYFSATGNINNKSSQNQPKSNFNDSAIGENSVSGIYNIQKKKNESSWCNSIVFTTSKVTLNCVLDVSYTTDYYIEDGKVFIKDDKGGYQVLSIVDENTLVGYSGILFEGDTLVKQRK